MTTDPHRQEQGRPLTRRSLLAMTGAVAGGLGAGVSLAPPAAAHGFLMQANEIAGQRLHSTTARCCQAGTELYVPSLAASSAERAAKP